MSFIHTEIPWKRWLKAILAVLPEHDSLAELARIGVRELHVSPAKAAVFVECRPKDPLEKLQPITETSGVDSAVAQCVRGDRVAISFDLADCFSHVVDIPRGALPEIDAILDLERQRLTPFAREEVRSVWVPLFNEAGSTAVTVRQVLIKTSAVTQAADKLKAVKAEPVALLVRNAGSPALGLALGLDGRPFGTAAYRFWGRATAGMAAALVASVTLLAFGYLNRQAAFIAEIEARAAQAATAASAVQERLKAIADKSAELSAAQALVAARPSMTSAIEALSAELPDNTSLEGFTFAGGVFTVTGTSETPEPLVALLEETMAFKAAGFSAPVFKNPGEPRSHFTLTFKLEGPEGVAP